MSWCRINKARSGCIEHAGRHCLFSTLIVAASLLSAQACAVDGAEITRLLRAGKHNDAMKMVEDGLNTNPLHPQLRLTEGVILAEQNRTQDAIAIFLELSEDHPDLPEPYNNLAVLYNRHNQFEKAHAALNMAIKANPNYATAYENLGDVYARMAAQSYGKASNLKGESTSIQSKLKVFAALGIPEPAPSVTTVAAALAPGNPPAPATLAVGKSQALVEAATSNVSAGKAPAVIQTAAPSEEEVVLSVVEAWAKAWQSKNMDAYLDAYDKDYVGNGAKTHQRWVTMRKQRIVDRDSIDLSIEKPIVELKGDTAIVSFRQLYASGTVHSDGMKTLTLKKKSGLWKIIKEVSAV